ncbi:MAG TPA: sulfate ABC transporter permease subunit CysT [Actinomycetota bacterium]|nr:sulfate ABC transporter permease subunit CysT [Actinomycetota bacterium]
MATAAQTVVRKRRLRAPAAKRLRHWGLRGAAVTYLAAMIVVPATVIVSKGLSEGLDTFRSAMTEPGAWDAIRLTLVTSALAAIVNGVFGTMLAYILVRYRFRGRGLLSAIVDLPFAIPTLVTGVMLVAIYGPNTPIGRAFASIGIPLMFSQFAVLLAICVVTLPFVVRTVQPVLLELDTAEEEAAQVLGASPWKTFRAVVMPAIRPAIAAGALLAFARGLGEFGSVVFVSGNLTNTKTAPILIFQLTSQFKPEEAAAVATMLFAFSFVLVLVTSRLVRTERKEADA